MPSRPSAYSSSIARSIDASPVESADCASYVRYPATRPRRSRHRQRPTLVPGCHRARSYLLESIFYEATSSAGRGIIIAHLASPALRRGGL